MTTTERVAMLKRDGWRETTERENEDARNAEIAREGRIYNGCTNVGLCRRFGSPNVQHVMGIGWFVMEPPQLGTKAGGAA